MTRQLHKVREGNWLSWMRQMERSLSVSGFHMNPHLGSYTRKTHTKQLTHSSERFSQINKLFCPIPCSTSSTEPLAAEQDLAVLYSPAAHSSTGKCQLSAPEHLLWVVLFSPASLQASFPSRQLYHMEPEWHSQGSMLSITLSLFLEHYCFFLIICPVHRSVTPLCFSLSAYILFTPHKYSFP